MNDPEQTESPPKAPAKSRHNRWYGKLLRRNFLCAVAATSALAGAGGYAYASVQDAINKAKNTVLDYQKETAGLLEEVRVIGGKCIEGYLKLLPGTPIYSTPEALNRSGPLGVWSVTNRTETIPANARLDVSQPLIINNGGDQWIGFRFDKSPANSGFLKVNSNPKQFDNSITLAGQLNWVDYSQAQRLSGGQIADPLLKERRVSIESCSISPQGQILPHNNLVTPTRVGGLARWSGNDNPQFLSWLVSAAGGPDIATAQR